MGTKPEHHNACEPKYEDALEQSTASLESRLTDLERTRVTGGAHNARLAMIRVFRTGAQIGRIAVGLRGSSHPRFLPSVAAPSISRGLGVGDELLLRPATDPGVRQLVLVPLVE